MDAAAAASAAVSAAAAATAVAWTATRASRGSADGSARDEASWYAKASWASYGGATEEEDTIAAEEAFIKGLARSDCSFCGARIDDSGLLCGEVRFIKVT